MTKVAIFGAGQIGKAVYKIVDHLKQVSSMFPNSPYSNIATLLIDTNSDAQINLDVSKSTLEEVVSLLTANGVTHVINALPFFLNDKIASAAVGAKCSYIDFTEDDVMADKVQKIYKDTGLDCAVKCGLAPGFINYIGNDLIKKIEFPDSLLVSVGALPRNVSYDINHPECSYNLTWSLDGLVNEYIRPCRIRRNGILTEVPALGGMSKIVLDGLEYEAAHTSGGIGSLATELTNVSNVAYMTIRYPGHYRYIRAVVQECHGQFDKIRKIFESKFSYTDDDVIVTYSNAYGKDSAGRPIRRSYSNKFYGVNGLTGIQSTTAGSGVAMLELMLREKVKGIVDHTSVNLADFISTDAFGKYYKTIR